MPDRRGFLGAVAGVAAYAGVGPICDCDAEILDTIEIVKKPLPFIEIEWFRFSQLPDGTWQSVWSGSIDGVPVTRISLSSKPEFDEYGVRIYMQEDNSLVALVDVDQAECRIGHMTITNGNA